MKESHWKPHIEESREYRLAMGLSVGAVSSLALLLAMLLVRAETGRVRVPAMPGEYRSSITTERLPSGPQSSTAPCASSEDGTCPASDVCSIRARIVPLQAVDGSPDVVYRPIYIRAGTGCEPAPVL